MFCAFTLYNLPHTEEEYCGCWWRRIKVKGEEYLVAGRRVWCPPYKLEGLEASTDGSSAQPTLTVANIDSSITALCLAYDDMLQAKVTIHDTLTHYLGCAQFPDEIPQDPLQERAGLSTVKIASFPVKVSSLFLPARWIYRD